MNLRKIAELLTVVMLPAACVSPPLQQGFIDNEDSHPHEIYPGTEGRFTIPPNDQAQRVQVRCTLRGPVDSVRLVFQNFTPQGWAYEITDFKLGKGTLEVEIQGETPAASAKSAYFGFANADPERLLWHQCYNQKLTE